ncbi:glycosyltransferase [Runella salmonicolor]|uniref:Glycosyltransferase n=1 Tax=Runella salmonicolor TaxID=2950278 RepID=A0ABT1FKJ2_9BACT|nr:glycosyltransferase [Runella salmonicolor]MCP1382040.1 glycosyltransferase [Runella salmonicolor]
MNIPKISIIVPVYNAQYFLERCINSIIEQPFKDLEIILINDGSTDRSGEMCDEFAKRDSRIRVLHQTNKGISYTRQFGIDHSVGEFIQFIDSDDWIEGDMFSELYNYATHSNLDILGSNFIMDLENKSKKIICQYPSREKFIKAVLSNEWGVVWKLFIRRSLFLNFGISFPVGINHGEDYIVCVKLLLSTNKIATIDLYNYHYNYKITESSLTRNSGIKSTLDQIYATVIVEDYINSNPDYRKYKKALIKRKLFYSYNLISDLGTIIFDFLGLQLKYSLIFLSPRSVLTYIILVLVKFRILINNSLTKVTS